MKPINIYELTRVGASSGIQKLERQMSGRAEYLKIKKWEIDSLRAFVDRLNEVMPISHGYEFYYSFLLPKLGKEFDLLRISSDYIINIELKSRPVSTEAIKKQLIQNRYYLSMLGKTIYSSPKYFFILSRLPGPSINTNFIKSPMPLYNCYLQVYTPIRQVPTLTK